MVRLRGGWWAALALWLTLTVRAEADETGLPLYTVRRGDTLALLALRATGDSLRFVELIRYNQEILADPDTIEPGMQVRLPPGWVLPGAVVPPGETPRAEGPPPPVLDTSRKGLDDLGGAGATPRANLGEVKMRPGDIVGDSIVEAFRVPDADGWERLTFFPALAQIERDFDSLMLRASVASDVEWGGAKIAQLKQAESARRQLQVDAAQVSFDAAKSRLDECKKAAYRAERLLRVFVMPDDEFKRRESELKEELADAFEAEQRVWDILGPYLQPQAWEYWDMLLDALQTAQFARAVEIRHEMERFRVLDGSVELDPDDRETFLGTRMDAVLQQFVDLTHDEQYLHADLEAERYREAMADLKRYKVCEREFVSAELFLEQQRKKRIQLQIDTKQGTGDALSADARSLAGRFSGVLGEVQLVDAYLTNSVWASLWWKSGIALRLAGDHEIGRRRIAQAAAVADDHRLPSGQVPPTLETWLREAEVEVLRRQAGSVRLHIPAMATLTVDGRSVDTHFGEAEVSLAPGIHRLVFWLEGSQPIMRLVGVVEGETNDFTWYEETELSGEDEELIGDRPVLPDLPPPPRLKRWHYGISAVGASTLGRPGFGADLTVRYLPHQIGGQVGAGLLIPLEPYWMQPTEDLVAYVRLHGALVGGGRFGRVQLLGGVGGWVDPLLGAGPMGLLDLSVGVRERLRIGVQGYGGYDLTAHFPGIPKWMAGGGLTIWL